MAILNEDESDGETHNPQQEQVFTLPNIDTVVIKDLPKTELEWVLVYALYVSAQGMKIFTEDDLKQIYTESGRWNDSRRKNFAANIKKAVSLDWIAIINGSNYSLLTAGKDKALEILQIAVYGNSFKKFTKAKKQLIQERQLNNIVDLGLDENQRQEIKQYLQSFSSVTHMERAVLIAYKLAQYGKVEFNEDSIFTALRIADLSASYDVKPSLTNGKTKKNFFVLGDTAGMYKLHHLGEDRAKELEKMRSIE